MLELEHNYVLCCTHVFHRSVLFLYCFKINNVVLFQWNKSVFPPREKTLVLCKERTNEDKIDFLTINQSGHSSKEPVHLDVRSVMERANGRMHLRKC